MQQTIITGRVSYGESAEDYYSGSEPSFSTLKHLLVSPQYYFEQIKNPFKGNFFSDQGTAVHHYLQNRPDLVFVCEEKGKALEKYKEEVKVKTNGEGIVVAPGIKNLAEILEENTKISPKIMELRNKADVEVGFRFLYRDVWLRGRADFVHEATIGDVKTSSAAIDRETFQKTVISRYYTLQAAMYKKAFEYSTGSKLKEFVFIPCHTRPDYEVNIYRVSDDLMERGLRQLDLVIDRYKEYVLEGRCCDMFMEEI